MKGIAIIGLLFLGLLVFGCAGPVQQTQNNQTPTVASSPAPQSLAVASPQASKSLELVFKDPGMPEVKYLQPTITEVQLQHESKGWVTVWSNPEGKTMKLTSDGAEIVLDNVSLEAGTYIGTRLKVSKIDVEADLNRDGDTIDKNVEIVLTKEEFDSLPPRERPQAPSASERPPAPSAPTPPPAPEKPQKPPGPQDGSQDMPKPPKPSAPPLPSAPPQPSAPEKPQLPPGVTIVDGFYHMGHFMDETHTVVPPYFDGIHNDVYLYPILTANFVYDGNGGKLVYDFTLHPFKPKNEQITVEVYTITASTPTPIPTPTPTSSPVPTSTPAPSPSPTTTPITGDVIFDEFNGATKGKGFGALTYEDSMPNLGKAVNLANGTYIKYSFPPWYKWDGVHSWNRNEAASGMLTEGRVEMWIKPRKYSGILTFNWADSQSVPASGYILHLGFTADGKLTYSVWGGNLDTVLVGKTTVPLNKWSHVGVSWSPNGTKLYLDGKADASTTANLWPAFSNTVFAYLNYWGASDLGLVDDFSISKVAEPSR